MSLYLYFGLYPLENALCWAEDSDGKFEDHVAVVIVLFSSGFMEELKWNEWKWKVLKPWMVVGAVEGAGEGVVALSLFVQSIQS